ncbi:hypothetical protein [Rhodococcus pyridinivorans]|uniref:Uncharacterized protein n=1 Tax=Rhodococcus pyridinivorans TaxID=103816 RepID=A0A7M2XQ59_9NOCA|nr:hypothetical protein [Rhodococcus pyridinivorans]QOV99533.1 hypothetical protein INP59_03790 [Rhodococcus pyridinivorans]
MSKYRMDTYCAAALDAAPGHKCLCTHHLHLHPGPHRCACGHLWGDPFVEMTYDEQRAFLGLKDIRHELAWESVARSWRGIAVQMQEMWAGVENTMRIIKASMEPAPGTDDYGLAGEK